MSDKAGIRFNKDKYVLVEVDEEIKLTTVIDGVVKEYDVTGGGGGGETWIEELLWENPNPQNRQGQVTTDVGYSTITKYEYIKVIYKETTSKDVEIPIIDSVENVTKSCNEYPSFGADFCGVLYACNGDIPFKRRNVSIVSNKMLKIEQCFPLNDPSKSAPDCLVVKAIYGIKKG